MNKIGSLFRMIFFSVTFFAFACFEWIGCSNSSPTLCAIEPYPPTLSTTQSTLTPTSSDDVWNFISEPDLQPMKVSVKTNEPSAGSEPIFLGPFSSGTMIGQTGSLILDNTGNPIWFRPLPSTNLQNADFRVQEYQGQSVLTWWQGTLALPPTYTNLPPGDPEPGACYYIMDSHYRVIKTVTAQRGYTSDEHEFKITSRGTALFTSTKAIPMDLTPYGGPANGYIDDCAIQEVDLETGKLLFFWNFLAHVDPVESKQPASSATSSGNVWDAYHCNSVEEGLNHELLISARNLWAIYNISKETGEILWQLGGTKNNFTLGSNARFFWQHDARYRPDGKISLFDDGCCNLQPPSAPEQESHGLILSLDFTTMIATEDRTFYHDPALFANSQGNLQALSSGNEFMGWGAEPFYSEYAAAGNSQGNGSVNVLYDAKMPGENISYRTFRLAWVGTPNYPPSIAVQSSNSQVTVYASWNGSTETTAWQVLEGRTPESLSILVPTIPREGFETDIQVDATGPFFQVQALDALGKSIGSSKIVRLQ